MNAKDLPEYVRIQSRRLWLKARYRYDGLRLWKLNKEIAYLEWKQSLLERHKTLHESREYAEGDDDE